MTGPPNPKDDDGTDLCSYYAQPIPAAVPEPAVHDVVRRVAVARWRRNVEAAGYEPDGEPKARLRQTGLDGEPGRRTWVVTGRVRPANPPEDQEGAVTAP